MYFIWRTMPLDGYTETTLELHWKATGWGTLKLHWNYTEMPLDGYTSTTLKCHCTSSTPQLHLQRTPTAPPAHPNCTSSAPPTVHLQRTSNGAPPSTPISFTYLHPHLQRTRTASPSTPTAPPSTTTFTNPCLTIKIEVHLSAPQKCTPPRAHPTPCAPPSTSVHQGCSHQSISRHGIVWCVCVGLGNMSVLSEWISFPCGEPTPRNDSKCEYIFYNIQHMLWLQDFSCLMDWKHCSFD